MGKKASFQILWTKLTEAQRSELRKRMIAETGISDMTLYRWREGQAAPTQPYLRSSLARIVSEITGCFTTAEELFPTK